MKTETKPKYFKAWLLFFILGTVGGFAAGAVLGGIAGFFLALLSGGAESVEQYQIYFQILGWIAGIPVSYLVFRWSVSTFIVPQFSQTVSNKPNSETEPPSEEESFTQTFQK